MRSKKYVGAMSSLLVSWPLIAAAFAGALIGNWCGVRFAPLLLIMLGCLGLVSRLWGMAALRDVEATAQAERSILSVGETVRVTYQLENKKPLPLIWLEFCQAAPKNRCMTPDGSLSLVTPESWETAQGVGAPQYCRRILFLLGFTTLAWETVWTAQRRGLYRLSALTLRSGDGFGLTQTVSTVSLSRALSFVVYPRLVPVNPSVFLRSAWQGQTGKRGWVEDPTVLKNLRDYLPTDSWKRIDWRMAARQEELQVKQFETVLPTAIHFIVDGASFLGLSDENSELEETLSILASLLLELDRAGISCGLSLPGTEEMPPQNLSPNDPALTVQDLMTALAAFDAQSASKLIPDCCLPASAQTVGQVWLVCFSPDKLTAPALLESNQSVRPGLLSWAQTQDSRTRSVPLSSLKAGGRTA